MMQRKIWLCVCTLLFASGFLQGCETLKGAKKDTDNTVNNIKKLPEYDRWLQENAW